MSTTVAPRPESERASGQPQGSASRPGVPARAARALATTVRRVPRAGRACFVIALVNATVWGVVVPPFQVPDEIAHFAYAQYVAEKGKPPPQGAGAAYSPQEQAALDNLFFFTVIGRPQVRGVLTTPEDQALRSALAAGPSPVGEGGASPVTNQPPLYYALEAVPYWLSPSHDIFSRLAFMRLLSALLAACTVLAIFLFLRELLPRSPWMWTVGALAAAFQPTFDFIASGVQGDNLLFLASALTFALLLRAYRRGFTTRRAAAIGAVVAVGVLAKLTFIALLPGIALALALLAWRTLPKGRLVALRRLGVAVAVAATPVLLYVLANAFVWHRGGATTGGVAGATTSALPGGGAVTLRETIDYTWELYLPHLWFMNHVYFTEYPLWATWFDGSIGHFGWLDYTFPKWVYTDARYLFYGLAALGVAGLVQLRAGIRPLLPIFACFAVMALGLLGAIGYAGIRYRLTSGYQFEQARYLYPLLVFYALFIALAARGAGRRWGPALGGALVILAMAHGLFAETLTISRYYG
jgi:4-amino-4-deoxy-L-arabinose transferase-like glycosyltransferase